MLDNASSNNICNPYFLTDVQRENVFDAARAEKEYGELGQFFGDTKDFLSETYGEKFYTALPDGFDREAFQDEVKDYMIKLIKESWKALFLLLAVVASERFGLNSPNAETKDRFSHFSIVKSIKRRTIFYE